MNVSEDFSKRLQGLMSDRKMSQAELARLLHTQSSTLARWFSGAIPQRNSLRALAEVLNVSERWLATGEGPIHGKSSNTVVSYVESSVMREDPPASFTQTELPDVKILVEMLQNGVADLATQPKPKLSTLLGLRALLNEIMSLSQNPNQPSQNQ